MGAAESTSRTNGTNQEEEERKQKSSTAVGVAATIAAVGVAAWGISRMHSDNTDTQENKSAMKMQMKTETPYVVHQSCETSFKKTWSPPPQGLLKMNTDGGHRPNEHYVGSGIDSDNLRPSGYGGILRDHNGKWIRGFIGHIGVTDSLKAEFHGIHKGLLLLNKLGRKGVILETDCQAAYQWVTRRDDDWGKKKSIHDIKNIIKECRELADKNKITIKLIDGDANKCADGLANIAIREPGEYEELMEPPNEMIYRLLSEDAKFDC